MTIQTATKIALVVTAAGLLLGLVSPFAYRLLARLGPDGDEMWSNVLTIVLTLLQNGGILVFLVVLRKQQKA